jgi:hypothetical protein
MMFLRSIVLLCLLGLGSVNAQSTDTPRVDDDQIRQKVVGTWMLDYHATNGAVIKRTSTIKPDGSVTATGTIALGQKETKFDYEASWRVSGGLLIETVTQSESEMTKPGTVSFDKVISIDDVKCVYRTMVGETITCTRKK